MRRSAQVALELAAPKRALAPLQALALPCNLVRQGLERAWDLSRDFLRLTQVSEAVLRPIRAVIQKITSRGESIEPTLERTRIPKPGRGFG